MKKILYLSFYFEPDLCAGSFRNTPLLKELARQCKGNFELDVITTQPNRYETFREEAPSKEIVSNYTIYRIELPSHNSGMKDQINSFKTYFSEVKRLTKNQKYDLVFASSSRLFTAYLGYNIAKKQNIPLYLDIRDIFVDTISDVLKNKIVKTVALPILKNIESKVFNYAIHINLISGGFKNYFKKFNCRNYTTFPNGIDDIFIDRENVIQNKSLVKTITYAGNIGQGQGLDKVIPAAAKKLGNEYVFKVIGDGGSKSTLIEEIQKFGVRNVELINPMKRDQLISVYDQSDFLFIHLNDYDAFKKVLPSKIFELATFNKPIIAGVSGFSYDFLNTNVKNVILFKPCDVENFVTQLKSHEYKLVEREEFIFKFKRSNVNQQMASSILKYLK